MKDYPIYTKKEIVTFILVAALILAFAVVAGREPRIVDKEPVVMKEIERANFCQKDGDCAIVGSKCPFGCNIVVNKDHADRIGFIMESYKSNCIYNCVAAEPKCVNRRCKTVFSNP